MTATLTITAGPDTGRTCDLRPGSVLVVGRAPDCGLCLSDPGVSRLHCRLIADADGVRLEDADSRYGTLVNHRAVVAQLLRSGDTIEIGDTELRFESESPVAETIPPQRLASVSPEWLPEETVTWDAADLQEVTSGDGDAGDLVGTTFVRFRVESVVARSDTGTVYRANDTLYQRPVALKVYRPALFADELAMSRFLRSMRTMVPLQHEHLIKLHAAGRSGGLCFTASEFVAGESAAQMIDRIGIVGMLDWRTTWRVAVGVTEALEYLHERQILHRSLHPGNVLIRIEDQCVKLGDSLLAKSLDELGQLALTARGDVVGDIFYLAPEQLGCDSAVDHRADLYSLGATVYALLTGRPPFVGSPADAVRQILIASPEPPKLRHLAIPSAFEGVVLRLLAKRPEDRFADAHSLLVELQRVGRYEGLTR
jgi:pSer/pThr/pTyr-binding forkhead associated (FHA) protein